MATALRKNSIKGWRRHFSVNLPPVDTLGWRRASVRPDFVFRTEKVAVFVDGDFWHGNRAHLRIPKSNRNYWKAKIVHNQTRDAEVNRRLRAKGWRVIRVWESSLKKNLGQSISRVKRVLAIKKSALSPCAPDVT